MGGMVNQDVVRPQSERIVARTAWPQWAGALVAGGLALLLYVRTAAPGLTWAHDGADGGDLIAAAMNWGVPHPSGYPTYCLLARLFALLPLGSIARRFNLFSSASAALAVSVLYLCARRMLERRWPTARWRPTILAIGSALLFGSGATWWSQAVITEVYAVQGLFAALCLWLALRLRYPSRAEPRTGAWMALGVAFGLGLGAHLTLVLLGPGLLMLLWPRFNRTRTLAATLGLILGLLVFLYLPLAAKTAPVVNWGGADTWSGFWWLLSGQPYQGYVLALPLEHLPARLGAWAARWRQELTFPGLLIALLGLASWVEGHHRPLAVATLAVALSYSAYAILYNTTDSYVYLLTFYMLAALWVAEGLGWLWDEMAPRLGTHTIWRALLLAAMMIVLPAWAITRNLPALDLSTDGEAPAWVQGVFQELAHDALLITGADHHTFALDYAQWVEGQRPDVVTIDEELLPYAWYREQLAVRHPHLAARPLPSSLDELIAQFAQERPIYLSSPRPELAPTDSIQASGPLWRISAPNERDGATR